MLLLHTFPLFLSWTWGTGKVHESIHSVIIRFHIILSKKRSLVTVLCNHCLFNAWAMLGTTLGGTYTGLLHDNGTVHSQSEAQKYYIIDPRWVLSSYYVFWSSFGFCSSWRYGKTMLYIVGVALLSLHAPTFASQSRPVGALPIGRLYNPEESFTEDLLG